MRKEDPTTTAIHVIRDRTRAGASFQQEREAVISQVVRLAKGRSVVEMKLYGGFTTMLREAITCIASGVNHGTDMIFWSNANELLAQISELREEAQRRCAAE